MIVTKIFTAIIGASLLLTSCVSSQKWIDDDVYVLKSVDVPTDTDISDETEYATFLLNQQTSQAQTTYYDDFFFQPYSPFGIRPHHILTGYSNSIHSNFYGGHLGWGYGFGNFNWQNGYGYNYYGFNYYGMNNTTSPYGNWGGYGNNYYSNNPYYSNTVYVGIHVRGPRGSISGYGGVRSNSTQSYKSAPMNPSTPAIKTEAKPVTNYDRIGRSSGPGAISSGRTIVNTPNGPTVTTVNRPAPTTPRPTTTTSRTSSSPSIGRPSSSSPRYEGTTSTGRTSGSGTISTGRTSSGTSSGGSRSTSGGGSTSGGTKTVGRR